MSSVETILRDSGYASGDIRLAQKVSRLAFENQLNLVQNIRNCERCPISLECHGQSDHPFVTTERVVATGPSNSPLMIIGDMPGPHEAKYGVPFIGAEGQLLTLILSKAGIDRSSLYMTYGLKCAGSRRPTFEEVTTCHRHLANEIAAVRPSVILTLGQTPLSYFHSQPQLVPHVRDHVWNHDGISVVHTHSLDDLLDTSSRLDQFKSEFWKDLSVALSIVKKHHPHYVYDRVGLTTLMED